MPITLATVTESGWVLRRKSDGSIWTVAHGNPDARDGTRPRFFESRDTVHTARQLPDHWEAVYVTRTVTLTQETEPQ